MHFPYKIMALVLYLIGTVSAQYDDAQPQHPQCPANQHICDVPGNPYGQDARSESTINKNNRDRVDHPLQARTSQSATKANAEADTRQRHRRATELSRRRRGTRRATRSSERNKKKVVLRHPLPSASLLHYRLRQYFEALSEAMEDRRHVYRRIVPPRRDTHSHYKLKAGNYGIVLPRMGWQLLQI